MRIIWDATGERMYPVAGEGLTSGLVQMIRAVTQGLAERGHTVHVVVNDLEVERQRAENLWYWPTAYHPTEADAVIMTQQINPESGYQSDVLIVAHTGADVFLGKDGSWAEKVEAFPVFSRTHGELLRKMRPTIKESQCVVVGLGVDLGSYQTSSPGGDEWWACDPGDPIRRIFKTPGRMLFANDPARGLFYLLDIFDLVKAKVPEATLHVAYDFDRQLQAHVWDHSLMAQMLLDCKFRIEETPGVVNLGALSWRQITCEQLECQVHCMPSDPPNVGTQTHGIMQMECAAAGCALVLSDVEAFPEVFGEAATILPVMGKFLPEQERRVEARDYADVVVRLMTDHQAWREASLASRRLAVKHTWAHVVDRWDAMLAKLREGVKVG